MSGSEAPRLSVGDLIRVEEPDYQYGTGRLLLRITAVGAAQREPDGLWLPVRGHEILWNGEVSRTERHALVRLAAVRIVPSKGKP